MEAYKVKHNSGKYLKGGYQEYLKLSKNGKTWNSKSAFSNFLVQICTWNNLFDIIDSCTLVVMSDEGIIEKPILPYITRVVNNYYNKNPQEKNKCLKAIDKLNSLNVNNTIDMWE